MQAHPGYQRLRSSSMKYSTCWVTFTGYPLINPEDCDHSSGHGTDQVNLVGVRLWCTPTPVRV